MSFNDQFGDRNVLYNEFHSKYYNVVLRECERLVGNYFADDVVSRVFFMLYLSWYTIKMPIPPVLLSWTYTVAKRYCVEYTEEMRKTHSQDVLRNIWETTRDEAQRCKENREMIALINQTRENLTHEEQELLDLILEGRDNDAIAKHFGISEMAVRKRKERLVKKIKKSLGTK